MDANGQERKKQRRGIRFLASFNSARNISLEYNGKIFSRFIPENSAFKVRAVVSLSVFRVSSMKISLSNGIFGEKRECF